MSRLSMVSAEVDSCPKCGRARRTTDRACAQCGLAVDRMAGFARPTEHVPEPLERAWSVAIAEWTVPARHDEILRLATCHDAWAWAARKYRELVRARGEDAIAARALVRLERSALLGMSRVVTSEVVQPYRATLRLLVVMMLVLAVGMVYTQFIYRSESSTYSR